MKIGFAFIIKNKILRWNEWKEYIKQFDARVAIINWDFTIQDELRPYQIKTDIKPGYGNYDYVLAVLKLIHELKRDCDRVVLLSESCFPMTSPDKLKELLEKETMYMQPMPFYEKFLRRFSEEKKEYIRPKKGLKNLKTVAQGIIFNRKMMDFYEKTVEYLEYFKDAKLVDEHYWILCAIKYNKTEEITFRNLLYSEFTGGSHATTFDIVSGLMRKFVVNSGFLFMRKIDEKTVIEKTEPFIIIRKVKGTKDFPFPYMETLLFLKGNQLECPSWKEKNGKIEINGEEIVEKTDNIEEDFIRIMFPESRIEKKKYRGINIFYLEGVKRDVMEVKKENRFFWVVMNEINERKSFNIEIDKGVKRVFREGQLMGDDRGPIVVYHGTEYDKLESILKTGLNPSKVGMLGPGFYFGDFRKAMRYSFGDSSWKKMYKRGVLIRYLLMPLKMKMIPEFKTSLDTIVNKDSKEVGDYRFEQKKYIKGDFLKTYDTVFLQPFSMRVKKNGRIIVARPGIVSNPEYLVKSRRQFKVLDYGESDMSIYKKLGEWDAEYENYAIL